MAENDPVKIIGDNPARQDREFGFKGYARTLAGLIANSQNETPLTIGIYGPWGSGKTTLMESVKALLDKPEFKDGKTYRTCKTVWFQAWKYKDEDEILAALIEEIFRAMKNDGFLKALGAELEKLIEALNPFKALGKITKTFTDVDLAEYFSGLEYKSKLGFYPTFQTFFDRLLWAYTRLRPKLTSEEEPDDTKGALVVFIDDLDRCPKNKIIKVLETIKLFMDKKGCVFVIGAAEDIIVKSLAAEYGREDAARFMEKIVQVAFRLPRIASDAFQSFVKNMNPDLDQKLSPHLPLLMPAMKHNPRQLKRFINTVNLLDGLLKNRERPISIDFKYLLFWNIIDLVYSALAEDIKDQPENLYLLRDNIQKVDKKAAAENNREMTEALLKEVPQSFRAYFDEPDLLNIVRAFDIPKEAFEVLRTLSGTLERPGSKREAFQKGRVTTAFRPGEMVKIAAGEFQYGDKNDPAVIEVPYTIDIYPVTNSEFEQFVLNKGYEREDLWEPAGWQWRQSENITGPRFWDDPKWKKPDHPVVGVSWYEAAAYAKWLKYDLPTEKQWERAARGPQGNKYPWGNAFDPKKCNTKESGIDSTTRVTRYPGGISPDGCYDMAGNVWEWTSDFYDKDKDSYVLRGGSWVNNASLARCAFRNWIIPNVRSFGVGFRCVRTLK